MTTLQTKTLTTTPGNPPVLSGEEEGGPQVHCHHYRRGYGAAHRRQEPEVGLLWGRKPAGIIDT